MRRNRDNLLAAVVVFSSIVVTSFVGSLLVISLVMAVT